MKRAVLLWLIAAPLYADPGLFSVTGLDGWTPQIFDGRTPTEYRLVRSDGSKVLQAECRASASGWIWKETVDLRRTPLLRWRWRVDDVYAGIREREKQGDDFPARVYVVRDGGWAVWRTRSLVYVWASTQPTGSDWPSPYTGQARIIALRSGAGEAGAWVTETRDVRADFRRYFGLDLAGVDGVAVMTDCDDHGGRARAAYGDIRLLPAAP